MTTIGPIRGVPVHIEGDGLETIVMIHGWPDTYRLWDAQVAKLKENYRCVRFTLPGFDQPKSRRAYSLTETLALFQEIIEAVSPARPVVLMLHDWGCIFGYQFYMEHPESVSAIIGIDIGDVNSRDFAESITLKTKRLIFQYQIWLAIAWWIGGGIGDRMTRYMAKALRYRSSLAHVCAAMNYPYFIRWMKAAGSYRALQPFIAACPFLYIYGSRKRFMFHSETWLAERRSTPKDRVCELPTDHWVMLRKPDELNQAIMTWLGERLPHTTSG